ncbi:molybdopterin converting factor subunit 1 [Halobacillus campisalis]|uniref:Molybdopterin synthase sulfur carrier subunit n=1 Tax=Halobacillus campisalis TaxID=435909 RepID=A0ABW2K4W0_9BACI|nr:molybdopterin converting factor subunit 1 [Halobacillus campisalis]
MNKILFFAALQEKAGKESIELDVSGKSVKQVKEFVAQEYGLAKINESMTAINEEFAASDDVIQENDVIAFIPPVSGG